MADNENIDAKKHIDEGWKEKAREERESLAHESASSGATEAEKQDAEEEKPGESGESLGEFPPPDFATFISGLATQAFVYLGQVESPVSGKKEKDLGAARHVLDTLGMLEEKTRGNLTQEEAAYLEELLYNLRMFYIRENDKGKTGS